MAFILSAERTGPEALLEGFRRYASYVDANRDRFPPLAYGLATSDWFYNPRDHRCPHDAWLQALSIAEPSSGMRHEQRIVAIRIRLLGAYHDGHIELHYPRVFRYSLDAPGGEDGHGDWRFDEFRLSNDGHLVHEIEWFRSRETGRWLIEADDVSVTWHPFDASSKSPGLSVARS